MLKSSVQKFIVLFLLLAFTSQTLATAAMTCELDKAMKAPSVDAVMESLTHRDMDHMQHDMSAMSAASDNSEHNHPTSDCCKTMGHCLFGGCSLAAASTSIVFLLTQLDSAAEDFYSDITPTPLASSLYRPPIIC
jgi:uncharacterized protein involved in copper resistance